MCGINGIVQFDKPLGDAERDLARMNDVLVHRGPDGSGVYTAPGSCVLLGAQRLSIVDLEGGAMPIVRKENGAEYAIVANGEFFNYRELRQELEKKYKFSTHSDIEVALVAYIEWGNACLDRLHGQFAFAIYDGAHERVVMARDRLGIKPLYYCRLGHALVFSSEPKGVLAHSSVAREPDPETITDYVLGIMGIGKSESLDGSFFRGVRALAPGTYAVISRSGIAIERYYDVNIDRAKDKDRGTLAADLRAAVRRAIREQVPDEVAYGIPLSGGLDSGIVAVTAIESEMPIAASAVRYDGEDNADYEHAKLLAQDRGIDLVAPIISAETVRADIDRVILALDRPFDSPRDIGLYEVYRNLHARGAKVALVGEGSDEFNLGYYYRLPGFLNANAECSTSEGIRGLLRARIPAIVRYFMPEFVDAALVEQLIERNISEYYEYPGYEDSLDRMQYYYAKKFIKGRLDVQDRLAMAHSIEARVPFCDEGVVDASLTVPPRENLSGNTEKSVLREAFADVLPPEIAHRRKSPLPESSSPAVYRVILDVFDEAFDSADERVWQYLDRAFARTLREEAGRQIAAYERGERISLGDGAKITDPVDFRIRHLFFILAFLRWYDLYFVERVFSSELAPANSPV